MSTFLRLLLFFYSSSCFHLFSWLQIHHFHEYFCVEFAICMNTTLLLFDNAIILLAIFWIFSTLLILLCCFRELELSKLHEEFLKLPKLPPRKSYIQRITELTKNSWKQDADIERILKETRDLQLESNSIRERLDRTYRVVDEKVFRY